MSLFNSVAVSLIICCSILLATCTVPNAGSSDIYCLKSLKESVEDPHNYLTSWIFNNRTEGFICSFLGVDCWAVVENKVLNIRLSGLGLKGKFPLGLENCTSLTGLDLSNNSFSGPIPSNLPKLMAFLTALDLSFNSFSGEIPLSIINCTFLNLLRLNDNLLTGEIPSQLGRLQRLKSLSVANNQLSGQVPLFSNSVFHPENFANNSGLCGTILGKPCKNQSHYTSDFRSGFVVGYVVFLSLVVVVFMLFCIPRSTPKRIIISKKKKQNAKQPTDKRRSQQSPAPTNAKNDPIISTLEKFATRMNYTDLREATNNFSEVNIIGIGSIGTMYKGMLSNGCFLAIKKLHGSQQFGQQFVSEITNLGRLVHPNLVPLLGFCIEIKERLLVYKYMSNGNLHDWLSTTTTSPSQLHWPLRVKIALGIARGLAWLHYECSLSVAHLNLTSKSILLDQNFEPKISNFEHSMFVNLNKTNSSNSIFIGSEFWELGFAKKDVHSFGQILLELITGKQQNPNELVDDCVSNSCSGNLYDEIDQSLCGQGYDGEIFELFRVAFKCVNHVPNQRPTMLQVYNTISTMGKRHDGLTDDDSGEITQT